LPIRLILGWPCQLVCHIGTVASMPQTNAQPMQRDTLIPYNSLMLFIAIL
jgi:hypothetical protein